MIRALPCSVVGRTKAPQSLYSIINFSSVLPTSSIFDWWWIQSPREVKVGRLALLNNSSSTVLNLSAGSVTEHWKGRRFLHLVWLDIWHVCSWKRKTNLTFIPEWPWRDGKSEWGLMLGAPIVTDANRSWSAPRHRHFLGSSPSSYHFPGIRTTTGLAATTEIAWAKVSSLRSVNQCGVWNKNFVC